MDLSIVATQRMFDPRCDVPSSRLIKLVSFRFVQTDTKNGRRGSAVGELADLVDDLVGFDGRDVFGTRFALFPGIADHPGVVLQEETRRRSRAQTNGQTSLPAVPEAQFPDTTALPHDLHQYHRGKRTRNDGQSSSRNHRHDDG